MTFQPLKKDSVLGTYYIQKYDAADEEDSHEKILYYDDVRSAVQGLKADIDAIMREYDIDGDEENRNIAGYYKILVEQWFPVFNKESQSHRTLDDNEGNASAEAVRPKGLADVGLTTLRNEDSSQSLTHGKTCDGSELDEHFFSRVEVITDKGREYVSWSNHKASIQDNGRTLKIFKESLSQPSLAQPQKVPASSEETNRSQRGDAGELKTQKKSEGGLPKGYKDEKHVARKGCSCKHGSGKITLALVEKENLCGCSCHKDTHNGDSPSTIKGIPKESDER